MTSELSDFLHSKSFILKILLLDFVFLAVVFFDFLIVRQVFGFLFLMFVPGILFLRLLKLENLQLLEIILFSVGFSIAFLIFAGLLINEIAPLAGISKPLTEIPLILILNSAVLLLCFLGSSVEEKSQLHITGILRSMARAPLAILFISLPFLSVLGTIWVNAYDNNVILLFMIIVISVLLIVGVLSKKLLPPELYPLVVLMIAISILYHGSLISRYLINQNSDILLEHSVFKITQNNGRWDSVFKQHLGIVEYERFNDMLSITVFPTIFSSLLNMDATSVLKILYPLIFSFVPLVLYHLWQTRVGTKSALISTFLFMAQQTFYTEMLSLTRQMTAELFFGLLFLSVLNAKISTFKKMICFTVFGAALIVSHYAISVIFLFFISIAWAVLIARKRWSRKVTLAMIVLFFVLMFSWYVFTSNSATFNTILEFGDHVRNEFDQWADPASRGSTVLAGLGAELPPSIWNSISRAFVYLIEFLIVFGFVGLITRRVKTHFDREYFVFTLLTMVLLAALILVPALASTLNMTRFFHILLFFLAPLAVLGAEFLINLVFKHKTELKVSILLMTILVPYFLFQTNFVYEVVRSDSWSLPLSKYRMDIFRLYVHDGYIDDLSAYGAQWLLENAEIQHTQTYSDVTSVYGVLSYYGVLYKGYVEVLSNTTKITTNGIIYLNRVNVLHGTIVGASNIWNTSELSFLNNMNKIYSNGGSEIYRGATVMPSA